MTISMAATGLCAFVAISSFIIWLSAKQRARAARRGARCHSALRTFIAEGAAQAARERRRKPRVAIVNDFDSKDRTSSVPWPDGGARASGPASTLLMTSISAATPIPEALDDEDAVTTPYGVLPPIPSIPVRCLPPAMVLGGHHE